jgi:hypothetical protein
VVEGLFPVSGAYKIHEKLGQILVMNWPVHRKRPNAGFRISWVIAPPWQHCADRLRKRLVGGNAPVEARAQLGKIFGLRIHIGRIELEVARILGGSAIHEAETVRSDKVFEIWVLFGFFDEFPHRLGVFIEMDRVFDDARSIRPGEGLEIGDKVVLAGEVFFGLLVVSADDGIVGALEEARFAVFGKLEAQVVLRPFRQIFELVDGNNDRSGNIIFPLKFESGHEVLLSA